MSRFDKLLADVANELLRTPVFDRGEWQGQRVEGSRATKELTHFSFSLDMPQDVSSLMLLVKPNLPWAEDHFLERVGGQPLNPPPSASWWPYAQAGHADHTEQGRFSHTYPERMWPKYADGQGTSGGYHIGIKFEYGDLRDLVSLMRRNPLTRQAYLPIWFPEDLQAALSGERVPCTLGYHFLATAKGLTMSYPIRSCDFVRHFRDDVYMAIRLAQWLRDTLSVPEGVGPRLKLDKFHMQIGSFHCFPGDEAMLRHIAAEASKREAQEVQERLMRL